MTAFSAPLSALIEPFVAAAPQPVLDDLKTRLRHTRWLTTSDGAGWEAGTNRAVLRELVTYWKQEFDWRRVEAQINAYPNFTTVLDGQRVHFLHLKGQGKHAIPLLLTHG